MRVYRHGVDTPPQPGTAVAIGLFDGLHLGHHAVIERAKSIAGDSGTLTAVLTFDFTDAVRPAAKPEGGRLLSPERFEELLREIGVDMLIRLPFASVRNLSPEEFAEEVLSGSLRAGAVCCGENFHFGRGAAAGARELDGLGGKLGFLTELVPIVDYEGEPVSATRIRRCLQDGKIGDARAMLGRPYAIDFTVVSGNRIGGEIGMRTINQPFAAEYLVPCRGVYASVATVGGRRYPAVTNIGVKPTVGSESVSSETHIQGFEGDLYGSRVPVELLAYLRPERKFENLEALARQMRLDLEKAVAIARSYLL